VKNQFNTSIKILTTDNGKNFFLVNVLKLHVSTWYCALVLLFIYPSKWRCWT